MAVVTNADWLRSAPTRAILYMTGAIAMQVMLDASVKWLPARRLFNWHGVLVRRLTNRECTAPGGPGCGTGGRRCGVGGIRCEVYDSGFGHGGWWRTSIRSRVSGVLPGGLRCGRSVAAERSGEASSLVQTVFSTPGP